MLQTADFCRVSTNFVFGCLVGVDYRGLNHDQYSLGILFLAIVKYTPKPYSNY